jgi:hypothetical protein
MGFLVLTNLGGLPSCCSILDGLCSYVDEPRWSFVRLMILDGSIKLKNLGKFSACLMILGSSLRCGPDQIFLVGLLI